MADAVARGAYYCGRDHDRGPDEWIVGGRGLRIPVPSRSLGIAIADPLCGLRDDAVAGFLEWTDWLRKREEEKGDA